MMVGEIKAAHNICLVNKARSGTRTIQSERNGGFHLRFCVRD